MDTAYHSLGSLLGELRRLFPSALIDSEGWERLLALSNRLPLCAADNRFGFEFHLNDPNRSADFFVNASPDTRLAEFYRRQTGDADIGLAGSGFVGFLEEQARDSHSFLARTGTGIILEYDLAAAPVGAHGIPGIFIVKRECLDPKPMKLHEDPIALIAALRSSAGWGADAAENGVLERAWVAMADCGITVTQAGVMPGRATRAIRLVAQGVNPDKVAGALEGVQWPGEVTVAMDILADFAGTVSPRVGLNIDITSEGVSSRLGMEMSRRAERSRPEELFRLDHAGWKPPIDRLEERGWCLPTKAGGLREWPRLEAVFGQDGVYQVRQVINHFKVIVDQDAISAKAYTGIDVQRTVS